MQMRDQINAPLQDYPDRSIWTTWTISYNAVRDQHEATANLLLLWSFLDNKDLWFEFFGGALSASTRVATEISGWVGDLANNELEFTQSMQLLRNHSLVESVEGAASYTTHPVVHKWARCYGGQDSREKLARLAVLIVGGAVPSNSRRNYSILQRRLLPHAQACSRWIADEHGEYTRSSLKSSETWKVRAALDAVQRLGDLFTDQSKLGEAEKMYMWALQGKEEALGPKHTSTLDTVNNLGVLYKDQDKLDEAEKMYMRALQGYREALGPKHTSTLNTVHNLGVLYSDQGKLDEAEKMYIRVLQGYEEGLGPKHTSTLNTVHDLGVLYCHQGKLDEAEKMYMQALQGKKDALGPKHTSTLNTVHGLGVLYSDQGKLDEAEKMYMQALQGYREALGPKHTSTLNTVHNLGVLYSDQGKLDEAEKMYIRALQGYEEGLGPKHTSTLNTVHNLGVLYSDQGKLDEAEKMYIRALQGYEEGLGPKHTSTLNTVHDLGVLYRHQGKLDELEKMYMRALQGYKEAVARYTSMDKAVHSLGNVNWTKAMVLSLAAAKYHLPLSFVKESRMEYLQYKIGDVVTVLRKDSSGWWFAFLENWKSAGWIASNLFIELYCRQIPE